MSQASTQADQPPRWLSRRQAAELLECDPRRVVKLAEAGYLTVRQLPGTDPRYLRSDVERIVRDVVRPAKPW